MEWRVTCKRPDGALGEMRTHSWMRAGFQYFRWLFKMYDNVEIERVG